MEYYEKNKETKSQLEAWYQEVKKEEWSNPQDVKRRYNLVSILKNNRIVFNIKGNKYRLVVRVDHKKQIVFIRFIGTHKEYDKIEAEEI